MDTQIHKFLQDMIVKLEAIKDGNTKNPTESRDFLVESIGTIKGFLASYQIADASQKSSFLDRLK